ncbi:hypothetical protein HaLaN_05955, partial [Haematococcus lacustris]
MDPAGHLDLAQLPGCHSLLGPPGAPPHPTHFAAGSLVAAKMEGTDTGLVVLEPLMGLAAKDE